MFFGCLVLARLILTPYKKYRELENAARLKARRRKEKWKKVINGLRQRHDTELKELNRRRDSEVSNFSGERDALKAENDELKKRPERPTLVGFFQDIKAHGWTKRGEEERNFEEEGHKKKPIVVIPAEPTGTLIVVTVGFVNDSPTPTTLLNFSLTLKVGNKTFVAMYPEERLKPSPGTWTPPEVEAENKEREKSNLLNYLDPPHKLVERGYGVQGFLVFYLDKFMWEEFPGQDWFFTLTITDAWDGRHDIVRWGLPPRPSQRL